MDLAYFPVVTNVVGSNDSFATVTFAATPSQASHHHLALAWAILRIRYPVLASVGLVDSTGNVSFSYDGFSNPSSAIADAETSLEIRQDKSSSDLVSSYLAGSRRVSRSHLSHLYFSSSFPESPQIVKPPTPPPILEHDNNKNTSQHDSEPQYTFLLCTPHYVADRKTLKLRLEELVSLLTASDNSLSENDLQAEIARTQVSLRVTQIQIPGVISTGRSPVSPIQMKLPLAGRFQRIAVASQVVCQ